MNGFTGIKVFTTTLARDREVMGEAVGRWLAEHPELVTVGHEVRQAANWRSGAAAKRTFSTPGSQCWI